MSGLQRRFFSWLALLIIRFNIIDKDGLAREFSTDPAHPKRIVRVARRLVMLVHTYQHLADESMSNRMHPFSSVRQGPRGWVHLCTGKNFIQQKHEQRSQYALF